MDNSTQRRFNFEIDGSTYELGEAEFNGVLFEVVAFGAAGPQSVSADGSPLSQMASLEDLEAAEAGWFYTSDRKGSLYVKVSGGEHTVEITE